MQERTQYYPLDGRGLSFLIKILYSAEATNSSVTAELEGPGETVSSLFEVYDIQPLKASRANVTINNFKLFIFYPYLSSLKTQYERQ